MNREIDDIKESLDITLINFNQFREVSTEGFKEIHQMMSELNKIRDVKNEKSRNFLP